MKIRSLKAGGKKCQVGGEEGVYRVERGGIRPRGLMEVRLCAAFVCCVVHTLMLRPRPPPFCSD